MNQFHKISIITPSYNQGQYIEQTIDSVLSQNYPNIEYIIIDGGSTDNTVEIIKKYEKHLKYWVSEPDKGQSDAINKGLKHITGEIVNWINSDDYYNNGVFKLLNELFSDPKINVVCGRSRIFKNNKTIKYTNGTDVYENNLAKTIGWARIDQPETFFRKSVLDEISPINTSLHYIMDRDIWIKYLLKYGLNNIIKTNETFVNFRYHTNSKTISLNKEFNIERNSYFNALSTAIGNNFISSKLKQLYKINDINLNYLIKDNKVLIINAINYFILLLIYEEYEKNNYNLVTELLKILNKKSLLQEDIKYLKKVEFKKKFLPVFIKNIIKRK
ncbi:MAG: glycosyltransferase [Bacteroidales bacterium]|nr:glycosyltransferase [Bacteroidales bacterium]